MIKINSLTSAYKIGEDFKSSYDGQKLQQIFFSLKEQLTNDTWVFYIGIVNKYDYKHYYSFGLAYEEIRMACEKHTNIITDFYIELKKCDEVHSLIQLGNKIGKNFDETFMKILGKLPVKDDNELFYSFSVFRSWLDLFYNLHKTKLFYFIKTRINDSKFKNDFIDNFLGNRTEKIYSVFNRQLIKQLAHNNEDRSDLWKIEFFCTLKTGILQMIFEMTFDFQLELQKNDIVYYKELKNNQMRLVKIKFSNPTNLFKGDSIFIYKDEKLVDIGIILKGITKYSSDTNETVNIIIALMYPKIDKNIFIIE